MKTGKALSVNAVRLLLRENYQRLVYPGLACATDQTGSLDYGRFIGLTEKEE